MVIVVAFGTPIEWLKGTSRSIPLPSVLGIPRAASAAATWRSQDRGAEPPPLPATAIGGDRQPKGTQACELAESLHEVEILHERQGLIATTARIERPVQQESLISIGSLAAAATKCDHPFQQASGRCAGVNTQVKKPCESLGIGMLNATQHAASPVTG